MANNKHNQQQSASATLATTAQSFAQVATEVEGHTRRKGVVSASDIGTTLNVAAESLAQATHILEGTSKKRPTSLRVTKKEHSDLPMKYVVASKQPPVKKTSTWKQFFLAHTLPGKTFYAMVGLAIVTAALVIVAAPLWTPLLPAAIVLTPAAVITATAVGGAVALAGFLFTGAMLLAATVQMYKEHRSNTISKIWRSEDTSYSVVGMTTGVCDQPELKVVADDDQTLSDKAIQREKYEAAVARALKRREDGKGNTTENTAIVTPVVEATDSTRPSK